MCTLNLGPSRTITGRPKQVITGSVVGPEILTHTYNNTPGHHDLEVITKPAQPTLFKTFLVVLQPHKRTSPFVVLW